MSTDLPMAQYTDAFTITHVSPSGGSVGDDMLVTFRGTGLLNLRQAIYKPRYALRSVTALSNTEATVLLPCRTMGAGVHDLTVLLQSSSIEYQSSGGTGIRFVCFQEPRFDGSRPVLGPSWPGMKISLTTTLLNCFLPSDQLYRCAHLGASFCHLPVATLSHQPLQCLAHACVTAAWGSAAARSARAIDARDDPCGAGR